MFLSKELTHKTCFYASNIDYTTLLSKLLILLSNEICGGLPILSKNIVFSTSSASHIAFTFKNRWYDVIFKVARGICKIQEHDYDEVNKICTKDELSFKFPIAQKITGTQTSFFLSTWHVLFYVVLNPSDFEGKLRFFFPLKKGYDKLKEMLEVFLIC